jgi:hypothetical protein
VAEAHKLLESNTVTGKIICTISWFLYVRVVAWKIFVYMDGLNRKSIAKE